MADRPPPRRSSGPPGPPPPPPPLKARARGELGKPPLWMFIACVAVLAFVVAVFWIGTNAAVGIFSTGREINFNTVGFAVGCFVSIGALYFFLREDQDARAKDRYRDWHWSAWKIVRWVTLSSWALGAAHLFFWAKDLTRV